MLPLSFRILSPLESKSHVSKIRFNYNMPYLLLTKSDPKSGKHFHSWFPGYLNIFLRLSDLEWVGKEVKGVHLKWRQKDLTRAKVPLRQKYYLNFKSSVRHVTKQHSFKGSKLLATYLFSLICNWKNKLWETPIKRENVLRNDPRKCSKEMH